MPSSTGFLRPVSNANLINSSTLQVKFASHAHQTAQHAHSTPRQISQNAVLAWVKTKWTPLRSFAEMFVIQLPHGTGPLLPALNAHLEHGWTLQISHVKLAQGVAHNATKTHRTPQLLNVWVAPKDIKFRTIYVGLGALFLNISTGHFTNA